jgi:hypothetical protein
MNTATLLTEFSSLNNGLDEALTRFEAPEDEEKKKKGMGGAVAATAGAAAAGAGVVGAHKAVMGAARSQGPLPAGAKGVGQAYKQAGQQAVTAADDTVRSYTRAWKNPRNAGGRYVADAGTSDRLKTVGRKIAKDIPNAVRKIIRTVKVFENPALKTVTELQEQADGALTKFAAKGA